jgi:hypothetical protein
MFEGFVLDGLAFLLVIAVAVNVFQLIKGFVDQYRMTNYIALKTGITITELRKMLEYRRFQGKTG